MERNAKEWLKWIKGYKSYAYQSDVFLFAGTFGHFSKFFFGKQKENPNFMYSNLSELSECRIFINLLRKSRLLFHPLRHLLYICIYILFVDFNKSRQYSSHNRRTQKKRFFEFTFSKSFFTSKMLWFLSNNKYWKFSDSIFFPIPGFTPNFRLKRISLAYNF